MIEHRRLTAPDVYDVTRLWKEQQKRPSKLLRDLFVKSITHKGTVHIHRYEQEGRC